MIFTYNKQNKSLTRCEETSFKKQGILERQDLEKWIETNPEILGEELFIITTEFDGFDKTNERLDILCLDTFGNIVIVELKRDDSGKYPHLQAINYASYCSTLVFSDIVDLNYKYHLSKGTTKQREEIEKSIVDFITEDPEFEDIGDKPRIILVSSSFRSEVTSSVLWLRKFGLDIKCVNLYLSEYSDGNIIVNVSTLIPLPETDDYIVKVEKKENNEKKHTALAVSRREFFYDIKTRLENKLNKKAVSPFSDNGYFCIKPFSIDFGSRVHYEWVFHRKTFSCELHFERGEEFNKTSMEKLKEIKDILEEQTKEKVTLYFDQLPGGLSGWTGIVIEKNSKNLTEELKVWATEIMEKMIEILDPELKKLENI